MTKTFEEIIQDEKITIQITLEVAKRLQRYLPSRSVDFDFDEDSIELLKEKLPFENCSYTLLKKISENIIIAHREKHRRTDISRLELMKLPYYRYHDDSFYYSVE